MSSDPTLPTRRAVADIVYAYRYLAGDERAPLSLRTFAEWLNQVLAQYDESVSHQTIKNWEDRVHLPRVYFMIQIEMSAPPDWRRDFARDMLAALRPKFYRQATEIGRTAMERSVIDTGPFKLRYDNRWVQG
jgi:hypothetical protein